MSHASFCFSREYDWRDPASNGDDTICRDLRTRYQHIGSELGVHRFWYVHGGGLYTGSIAVSAQQEKSNPIYVRSVKLAIAPVCERLPSDLADLLLGKGFRLAS